MIMGKFKKGVTLIELIVTLALISIVLTGIYSIFGFGQKTFIGGTKQYDLQSSIRLAEDYIIKEVRYAPVVTLMDKTKMSNTIAANGGVLPYENFIYYDDTAKCIIHKNAFFTKKMVIGKSGSIEFSTVSPLKELYFKIAGEDGDKKFDVQNKIYCLNLHLTSDNRINVNLSPGATNSNVVYYKSNDDLLAEKLKPLASLGGVNKANAFNLTFAKDVIGDAIVVYENVDSASISHSTNSVSITCNNAKDGAFVLFTVTFIDNLEYGYIAIYDSEKGTWAIK